MKHITLVTTGGTIDKQYGAGKGVRDLHIGSSFAFGFLEKLVGKSVEITPVPLMMKDSLDMDEGDRSAVVLACRDANTSRIIITHGTDTMLDTAKDIAEANLTPRRTIVLTGSLQPAVMKNSDAEFNLGLALGAVLHSPPGIYIAMNGVHSWSECMKDAKTGMFVSA